jgi:hypothetical protein
MKGRVRPPIGARYEVMMPGRGYWWHPRCNAIAKSTGMPCRMKSHYLDGRGNFRCRLHGALSSGPKTLEGKARCLEGRQKLYNARRAAGLCYPAPA